MITDTAQYTKNFKKSRRVSFTPACLLRALERFTGIADKKTTAVIASSLCAIGIIVGTSARADTFGSGANGFSIDFVTVGNPGNPADTSGEPNPVGRVDYTYRMGAFEVSRDMVTKANLAGNLGVSLDPMDAVIGGPRPEMPATGLNWLEAAKFVNWLNESSGHMDAYKFDSGGNFQLWQPGDAGYDANNAYRNGLARYFLPSTDEWYKAAFHDSMGGGNYFDYPTGSNSPPTPVTSGTLAGTAVYLQPLSAGPADITLAGGLSSYGTMAQGGNVYEFEETDFDLVNDSTMSNRGLRGGTWRVDAGDIDAFSRNEINLSGRGRAIGFRVASQTIPEPTTAILAMLSLAPLAIWRTRRPAR